MLNLSLIYPFSTEILSIKFMTDNISDNIRQETKMLIDAGEKAPDFTLPDANGNSISLKDCSGKKIILWFFPKANTPG